MFFKEMTMERKILLAAVVMLCAAGFAQAQDSDLHGSVDFTYQSKYLWRGFDIFGDKSAMQPGVDLDLFGSGLGISVLGHRANSSDFEEGERWDYTLYYQNMLFENEAHALMYRLGWMYYNYPDRQDHDADLQEIHAILSLPKMCPAGVVPSYTIAKLWPSSSGSQVGASRSDGTASGFWHIFRLDYPLVVGGVLPDTPEQILNLSGEIVYNDGVGPRGENVDHDWSNLVFGVSTGINLADELVLTPGVYYQATMDSSVNDDNDETWASLSVTYEF